MRGGGCGDRGGEDFLVTSAARSACERALRTSDRMKHSLAAKPAGSLLTGAQRDGAQGDLCPKQRSVTSLKGATLGDRGIHPKAFLKGADGLLTQTQAQE